MNRRDLLKKVLFGIPAMLAVFAFAKQEAPRMQQVHFDEIRAITSGDGVRIYHEWEVIMEYDPVTGHIECIDRVIKNK